MFRTLTFMAAFAGCATILSAQAMYPDTFKVNYFSNAVPLIIDPPPVPPDATVRLTNAGTSGGNLCADLYVFDPNQELSECCSCLITPDGLLTLSVDIDLADNPLTGVPLNTGTIKILSAATTNGSCVLPTSPKPSPGIHAWATHLQDGGSAMTETEFLDSGLSAAELSRLGSECSAIKLVGSGKGVCRCRLPG